MSPLNNISGLKFGRLFVVRRAAKIPGRSRHVLWECICECGVQKIVSTQSMTTGHTKSCGCLKNELAGLQTVTHGGTSFPEFRIWQSMKARCENQNVEGYENYGGRGITVCERWREFENFYADMGQRPSSMHSIDRRNNDGNYSPDNCRWVTKIVQSNNKRNTRHVIYRGNKIPLHDAVQLAGNIIHPEAAWVRIKSGWSIERALETPRLFASHASKEHRFGKPI